MRNIVILLLLTFVSLSAVAQKESTNVKKGNEKYKKSDYLNAEVDYRRALGLNIQSFEARFNLGDAMYKQGKYQDAIQAYSQSVGLTKDKLKLASAQHNIGNAHIQLKEYDKSVEAYKQALLLNPKDNDTRYNLACAQALLRKQKQKEQQKEEQQQEENNQEQKQEEKQAPPPENKISKENADQILEALKQDENNIQQRVKEQQNLRIGRKQVEKDW